MGMVGEGREPPHCCENLDIKGQNVKAEAGTSMILKNWGWIPSTAPLFLCMKVGGGGGFMIKAAELEGGTERVERKPPFLFCLFS